MSLRTFVQHVLENPRYLPRRLAWELYRFAPERTLQRRGPHGELRFSSKDRTIGRMLYLHDAFDFTQVERTLWLLAAERPQAREGVLLDVGANIGTVCIPMIARGAFRRAVAFEPAPKNHQFLLENISKNGLSGTIEAEQLALSCSSGEADLLLSEENFGDHRVRPTDGTASGEAERARVRIQVARLDDVLQRRGLEAKDIGLLWMDTQGHEDAVLEGAPSVLAAKVPLVVEYWPEGLERAGTDPSALLARLAAHYEAFYDLGAPTPVRRPVSELSEVRHVALTDLLLV